MRYRIAENSQIARFGPNQIIGADVADILFRNR